MPESTLGLAAGDRPPRRRPTSVHRRPVDLPADPFDVLRRARGTDRLVALVGSWRAGDAVLAWDPLEVAQDPFADPFHDSGSWRDDALGTGFGGGWIGSWGYRLGGDPGRAPSPNPRPVPSPACRAAYYDRVLRWCEGTWWFEQLRGLAPTEAEERRAASFLQVLERPPVPREFSVGAFTLTPSPERHRASVRRAIEHIVAGDVFQVNLAARLDGTLAGDPLDLFCAGAERLRPAYAAFVSDPEGAVASFSPELFLRRVGDEVLTSPIKGTAPLDTDPSALSASAKDRAENVMIVDLMRNDLGRVAVPGSVHVGSLVRVERHAVWQLVSDVTATLRPGVSDADLLRASFPPGSVTGAPKVRAMQLIDELESTARETYTGAIGYLSPCAGLELNVAIRTFETAGDRVWLGVGGGIVADSTPEGEYTECLVKAEPLIEAVGGRLSEGLTARDAPRVEATPPRRQVPRADPAEGVFETLLVRYGAPVDLSAHLARLTASCLSLYGEIPDAAGETVSRRAAGLAGPQRLRLDVRPFAGGLEVTVTTSPLDRRPDTVTLVPRVVPGGLGPHKWSDRRVLDGARNGCDGLLVVDDDGAVLETDTASLFAVFDDGVRTPPLDGRILPGTTRARVLRALRDAALPVRETPIAMAELRAATEVFTTNALRGVVTVAVLDGLGACRPGPLSGWLRGRLEGEPATAAARPRHPGAAAPAHVLVIDNYDSFVYNLVQYLGELGAGTTVVRNDRLSVDELASQRQRGDFTHVLISPGPGGPASAGVSVEAVRRLGATTPILGVCLGHQAIVEAYGGRVVRGRSAEHGKPAILHHDGIGVHTGLTGPQAVGRYHSLVLDEATLPPELVITSRTPSGIAMGVRHTGHQVEGLQWHPESILTADGHLVLGNFLAAPSRPPG